MSSFVLKFDESPFTKSLEISISSLQLLTKEITELLNNAEGSAILQRDGDDFLLLGVEGDVGFVQYDPGSKGGDYLWVKDPESENGDAIVNFNVGGTETEIYKRRCVEKNILLKAALYFYERGKLIEAVWEIDEV